MTVFLWLIFLLAACGLGALLSPRGSSYIGAIGPLAALSGGLPLVCDVLKGGGPYTYVLSLPFPFEDTFFHFSSFDAIFMIPVLVVGAIVAIFASLIVKPEHAVTRPHVWFFMNMLIAGMMVVLVSSSTLVFLTGWEIMSWAAFFLICTNYRRAEVLKASIIYFISVHIGFVLIIAGFFLYDYAPDKLLGMIFILVLVGFGLRTGLFPFHIWIPEALTAPPCHISALIAGVMTNMGLYAIWRLLSILPIQPIWWGYLLLILGAISAVYGILLAMIQQNLKRLLAYGTIGHVGIMFMGLGMGYLAEGYGYLSLRDTFFLGVSIHMVNHALFTSLLFIAASVVINQTDEPNINYLGGLIKKLPATGVSILIGSAASIGLPPFNGFISQFIFCLGAMESFTLAKWEMVVAAIFMLTVLALTGGLAFVCYTQLAGIVLLGESRSKAADDIVSSNRALRLPLLLLSGLCIASGLVLPILLNNKDVAPKITLIGVILIILTLVLYRFRIRMKINKLNRTGTTWSGGYSAGNLRMQYSGSSYVQPVAMFIRSLLFFKSKSPVSEGDTPQSEKSSANQADPILEFVYRPLFKGIYDCCMKLRWLQNGSLNQYVLYVALILMVLLIWNLL